MANKQTIFVDSDNVVEVAEVMDPGTGDIITTATVTLTILDKTGTPVAGQSWPLNMLHDWDEPGTYAVTLSMDWSSVYLTPNQPYTANIFVNAGFQKRRTFNTPLVARTSS